MKLKVFITLCIMVLLCGCSNGKKVMTCTLDLTNTNDKYILNAVYKVEYNNNYVTNIKISEKYISEVEEVLNYYNESKFLKYFSLKDKYENIEYNIDRKEGSLQIDVDMDFSKIDVKHMSRNGDVDSDYIVGDKLTITGAKKMYEAKGAKCTN